MEHISVEQVLGLSDEAVDASRLAGQGVAGRLPLTEDMLRIDSDYNVFL
jgi:hypothetical protein